MTFDILNDRIDVATLMEHDVEAKGGKIFDANVAEVLKLYEDGSTAHTQQLLRNVGVTLDGNPHPVQVSLLRYVTHRIAVAYDKAPTRFLMRMGLTRVAEGSTEHREMMRVVEQSELNLAMRQVDRYRALVRQSFIRYVPVDSQKGVKCHVFTPNLVARSTDPSVPDVVDQDQAIALRLGNDTLEIWFRDPGADNPWRMVHVDSETGILKKREDQPFGEDADYVSPYGSVLPISLIYDDFSGGVPWLPPRISRVAWSNTLNILSNQLLELVVQQAHVDEVHKTENPNSVTPMERGPNIIRRIDIREDLLKLDSNPKLNESAGVSEFMTRLFLLSEDINPDELAQGVQPVTGAALRVRERGLIARREAQLPLARRDERIAWEKLRAVHNYHASFWSVLTLKDTLTMHVELGDVDIPVSAEEALNVASRKMALGTASVIDVIMTTENLTREQAIERYHRIKEDNEKYPAVMQEVDTTDGDPGMSDNVNAVREQNGRPPADSIADAVTDVSAADRRAERRAN